MKLKNVLQVVTMLLVVFLAGCKKDDVVVSPKVTSTDPISNATNVAVSSKISAIFSVAMDPSTITTARFTLKQGTTPVSGAVDYTGTTATFTPAANLTPGTLYTATITTGAKATTGASLAKDYSWTFTTASVPDTTPPTVTTTDPANSATAVAVNHLFVTTFGEAMDQSTLNTLTITLKQGTTPVSGAVTSTSTTATFTPASNLGFDKVYTGTITTGAKDMAGNALASNHVFTFTTASAPDTALPMVNSTDPANNATGVGTNKVVALTFSEAMNPSTISATTFTLKQGTTAVSGTVDYSGTTGTFTPSNLLTANLVYTATITTGAKDLAGNALAANTVWSFTTGPATGPAFVDLKTAGNYVILAKTGISTTGTTLITGNIGVSPIDRTGLTGFSETMDASNLFSTSTYVAAPGKLFAADYTEPTPTNMGVAILDMQNAYTDAAGRSLPDFTELGAGEIGSLTLVPGLYKWGGTVTISTDVTISGGANDVWIFQIGGDLTESSAKNVTLTGNAQAKNVFWQVAGTVAINGNAHFEGVVLSMTGITLITGATMKGSALAQTAVILDSNAVTKP